MIRFYNISLKHLDANNKMNPISVVIYPWFLVYDDRSMLLNMRQGNATVSLECIFSDILN